MRGASPFAKAVGAAAFLTLFYCATFWLTLTPAYETGDDPTMALIAAGTPVMPASELIIFSNVVLGILLKCLYAHASGVNWQGVMLYATLALALGGLFLAALWRGITLRALLCCLGIAGIALPSWMSLQFTLVAMWAGWSGAFLFLAAREAPPRTARFLLALGTALVVLGCLVRVHAAVTAVVMLTPWLLDVILPVPPRRIVAAIVATGALVALTSAADSLYYRSQPGWSEWLAYNQARANLHDRYLVKPIIPTRVPGFERVGWTLHDLLLFERGVFFDPTLYDVARLRTAADVLAPYLPPPTKAWMRIRLHLARKPVRIQIGLPILLCLCFARRRGAYLARATAQAAVLIALGVWLGHGYKLEPRHLRALTDTLPLASMMWLAAPIPGPRRGDRLLHVIGLVALVAYARADWASLRWWQIMSAGNRHRTAAMTELFRRLDRVATGGARRDDPLVYVSLGQSVSLAGWNPLAPIDVLRAAPLLRFGWLTHSPHYRAALERQHFTDLYTDVIDHPNVVVISNDMTTRLFLDFLREHRGRTVVARPISALSDLTHFGSQAYRLHDAASAG